MIADIFSVFDDQNGILLGTRTAVWRLCILALFIIIRKYWASFCRLEIVGFQFRNIVYGLVSQTKGKDLGGFNLIITRLFGMIVIINLTGLIPYIFRIRRHLVFRFCIALPLWLSLLVRRARWNYYSFIAHFLPRGAPGALNPFLVLVEIVRVAVRPITLSIRLTANMGAGHIILCLVGRFITTVFLKGGVTSPLVLYLVNSFYFIFELAICCIQGYIFSLLLILYSDEHS